MGTTGSVETGHDPLLQRVGGGDDDGGLSSRVYARKRNVSDSAKDIEGRAALGGGPVGRGVIGDVDEQSRPWVLGVA